ncbi:MAG: single-stranded DNA-binding protein [Verrucomicrobiota bacterium]
MANFNKVILAGNLTRDPELRYTPKGTAVAKLGMAINRSWTTETGEKREEATFVDVDAFGKQAEVISQYLRKGRSLLVEGRLRLESWDDKQTGAKRSKLGVVLESFSFLDSGNREGGGGGGSAPQAGAAPAPRPQRPAPSAPAPASQDGPPPDDDDVPF